MLILIFKEAGDRVHATAFNTSHEQFVAFFAHVQEPLLSTVRSLCIAHCPIDTFFFQSRKRFYRRHDAAVESWSVLLLLLVHNLEAGQNRRRHVGGS